MRLAAGFLASCAAIALSATAGAKVAGCDFWTGATSHSWSVGANWSAGVPTASTPVCITAAAQRRTVAVFGRAHAATVLVGGRAQLELEPHSSLAVTQNVHLDGTLVFVAASAALATPTTRVRRAGRLVGIGAIAGNVINAGWVMALDGASRIPLRISGTYRELPSGTLFTRDEGGRFVHLDAGRAELGGRLDLLILDALMPGSKYAVVFADHLSGTFAHLPPGYVMRYRRGVATAVVTPVIRLGRQRVRAGSRVMVSGASFGYGGTVHFRLDGVHGALLGAANVNSVGGFGGFAVLPSGTPPGLHLLVAVKPPFGYTASAPFTVPGR